MPRITNLSEYYGLDATALERRGVYTVDDLWACVGRNVDQGLARVVDQTGISHDVLLAFLIVDVLEDPRRSYRPNPFGLWLGLKPLSTLLKRLAAASKRLVHDRKEIWSKIKEHRFGFDLFWLVPKWMRGRAQTAWGTRGSLWPDLLLIGLPLLVIALAVRAQWLNQRVVQRVAVKPGVALSAFSAIDTQKLIARPVIDEPDSFASVDDLKQRYPLKDLAAGELVKEQMLLPMNTSSFLTGRHLVSLPINSGRIPMPDPPKYGVRLMLAPRDKEKPGAVIEDVIVLAIRKENAATFVTVALTDAAVATMQPLAGISDIYILETAH